MEILESMVSRDRKDEEIIGEKERRQQQLIDQEKEIVRLQELTKEHNEQLERITLMSSELKELLSWKENEQQTTKTKVSEYEQQLQESNIKQIQSVFRIL